MPRPQAPPVQVARWRAGDWRDDRDQVAAEEPLQLSLDGTPLSIVMRTPGNDLELALGLLLAEQVIRSLADVRAARISAEAGDESGGSAPPFAISTDLVESNQVDIRLRGPANRRPERSFLSSSACGVCGATTVESLALDFPPLGDGPVIDARLLTTLGGRLREQQRLFERTGGLHAAGLFDEHGELQLLREDVGRHNAVDKVVGRSLLDGRLPLGRSILAVSGRGGSEPAQKAGPAGPPALGPLRAPAPPALAPRPRCREKPR